jgi:hypothetical protein
MTPRINSVSNEKYINFKSFYIVENYRGTDSVNEFIEAGNEFLQRCWSKNYHQQGSCEKLPC